MLQRPLAAPCTFGAFELLSDKRLLLRHGASVALTPKAFATLVFLIEHRDRVVAKDELLRALWPDVIVEEGNLTQQIFLLRKALEDSPDGQRYIATIPRVGYRFVGDVTADGLPGASRPARRDDGPARLPRIVWVPAAITVITAMGIAGVFRTRPQVSPLYRFQQLTADPGVESFPSLSPDGASFVYASGPLDFPGDSRIYLRRVGQENAVNLSGDGAASDRQPAYSPDGEWIAFRSERQGGGLFRMPSGGGAARLIVNEGYNPSWSPDAKFIAYSTFSSGASPYARRNGGQLWTVDVTSGARVLLSKGEALQPSWSPHGDRVAYWGGSAVYTIAASGGDPKLAAGKTPFVPLAYYWNPVWAPDGRHLYFSSNQAGSMGLWRVPIDERTGDPLGGPEAVPTPTAFSAHVSFSRSGDRFLFASLPSRMAIQRLEFDPETAKVAGVATPVTKDTRGWVWPDASPDGHRLAFQSAVTTTQEDIYVSNADGTDLRQLINDAALDRVARWSPDGKRIAFYSGRDGTSNIWVINAAGNDLRQVTFAHAPDIIMMPVWSPDGRRMAASGLGRGTFVFDLDRPWDPSTLQFLSAVARTSMRVQAWSWSSDGRRLAGTIAPTGGIAVFSFDTNTYSQLTTFGATPLWLNDGRRLLFAFEDRLVIVDSRTKATKEVATFPRGRLEFATGGGFTITKDNRTIYAAPVVREGDIWMATMVK